MVDPEIAGALFCWRQLLAERRGALLEYFPYSTSGSIAMNDSLQSNKKRRIIATFMLIVVCILSSFLTFRRIEDFRLNISESVFCERVFPGEAEDGCLSMSHGEMADVMAKHDALVVAKRLERARAEISLIRVLSWSGSFLLSFVFVFSGYYLGKRIWRGRAVIDAGGD